MMFRGTRKPQQNCWQLGRDALVGPSYHRVADFSRITKDCPRACPPQRLSWPSINSTTDKSRWYDQASIAASFNECVEMRELALTLRRRRSSCSV